MHKLNLGSGGHVMPNWMNVDLHFHHRDVIRDDMRTLNKIGFDYPNFKFELIYTAHAIIYVHPDEWTGMFKRWYELLQDGGKLIIEYPTTAEDWEQIKYLPDTETLIDELNILGYKNVTKINVPSYSIHTGSDNVAVEATK